jgi:hypothetical protein
MTSLVFHQSPRSLPVLVRVASGVATPYAGSSAQSFFEPPRQSEMANVRTAIKGGVDVNSRNADGNTLLMQTTAFTTGAGTPFLPARFFQ